MIIFLFLLDSCEPYDGLTCKSLDGYANATVEVTRTKILQSQLSIEEKITLFSKSVLHLEPSEGCKDILRVLLCQAAFPLCTETATKQLCSVYCRFNQTLKDLCPSVSKEFTEFVASNTHFMSTPDCSLEDGDQCMAIQIMSGPCESIVSSKIQLLLKIFLFFYFCLAGNTQDYSDSMKGKDIGCYDSRMSHSKLVVWVG